MFKLSPASLQTFIDTPKSVLEDRVQYSTVHIPNVFCDGHIQIINCVGIVRQVHRDFLITLYKLINFCNYMNIYSTGNSEGFSCILCYLIACGMYMEFGISLDKPEDASHYGNRWRSEPRAIM
jgi:hypothetical protein